LLKKITSSKTLKWFYYTLYDFLDRFDWTLSYAATNILEQEKRGDERFIGVCYDACKYLAQKFENKGIEYKSYWICGYDIKSISLWLFAESLHSFNICKINGIYYFADCYFATTMRGDNCIFGFGSEEDALAWAAETFFPKSPFVLREFNPIKVKTGNHILYSLRRLFGLKG
jgi:hypothetical protein